MNTIDLKLFDPKHQETIYDILVNSEWPFHSGFPMTQDLFKNQIEREYYTRSGVKTFVIQNVGEIVGFVRLFELGEDETSAETPLFDIRIVQAYRGQGIGKVVVQKVVNFVFENYPNKIRIEATTRIDNKAMRQVLVLCHFAKEAHYRQAWNCNSGQKFDAIGYGILREDWKSKSVRQLDWTS